MLNWQHALLDWLASVEWSTVIVAVVGFMSTCLATIYTGYVSIKSKQREQLTQTRMEVYTEYIKTVYTCISESDNEDNIRAFYGVDWRARIVAGRRTRDILNAVRKTFSSLDHPSLCRKGNAMPHDVMILMDKLSESMLHDLKSHRR